MTTIKLHVSRRFKYLWLKSIHSFDRRVHCARSFKGSYHPGLSSLGAFAGDIFELAVDPTSAPFHYLCGVTPVWADNLHVPFRSAPGAPAVTIEHKGITIRFSGGVEVLPIQPPRTDVPREFGTCRNWLFGDQYFDHAARSALTASSPLPSVPDGIGSSNSR